MSGFALDIVDRANLRGGASSALRFFFDESLMLAFFNIHINRRCVRTNSLTFMNDSFATAVRHRVAAVVFESESGSCDASNLELELRFGSIGRTSDTNSIGMCAGLWYATFEVMSKSPSVRIAASKSQLQPFADSHNRIIHTSDHRGCRLEEKRPVMASCDVPFLAGSVRVAASLESAIDTNVCRDGAVETPFCAIRERDRRSVYVVGANGVRSCWRFDFTRVDTNTYEIEIELELKRALKQTRGLTDGARIDAIMAQLGSMIDCLVQSLQQADRLHSANMRRWQVEMMLRQARLTGKI